MKKYDCIAFDLDGTLTNPEEGLIKGFVYAFTKLGIDYGEKEALKRFIGPPLFSEWQREFGFTPDEADEAIRIFREYYNSQGWHENIIYDGIKEMLEELKNRGKTLVVATSKPEDTAKKVLKLFDIDKYFDFIGGADGHRVRDKKWEVLEYSLKAVGIGDTEEDRSRCIMVGDRKFDAEGAKICKIDSLAILWGHGKEDELQNADFTYIAKDTKAVLDLLK